MNARGAVPHSYFRELYDGSPDPWGFDERWYEHRKFDLTMACLPEQRYRRALEPGCSNGALTERLASRCDELIAFDFVDDVVQRCRARMARHAGVHVRHESFPSFWPPGDGDLVVWSEIVYYLTEPQVEQALIGLERWLEVGGHLVAVHYTGATDYPVTGSEIGRIIDDVDFLQRYCHHVDGGFEIGVWQRRSREAPMRSPLDSGC